MGLYKKILNNQTFGYADDCAIETIRNTFEDESELISKSVKVYIYKVHYRYTTKRGNIKYANKVVVIPDSDIGAAKAEVIEYINEHNKQFPYRMLSNVKILDVLPEELLISL